MMHQLTAWLGVSFVSLGISILPISLPFKLILFGIWLFLLSMMLGD